MKKELTLEETLDLIEKTPSLNERKEFAFERLFYDFNNQFYDDDYWQLTSDLITKKETKDKLPKLGVFKKWFEEKFGDNILNQDFYNELIDFFWDAMVTMNDIEI